MKIIEVDPNLKTQWPDAYTQSSSRSKVEGILTMPKIPDRSGPLRMRIKFELPQSSYDGVCDADYAAVKELGRQLEDFIQNHKPPLQEEKS